MAAECVSDSRSIDFLKDKGVILSCGHTNATYQEGRIAFTGNGFQAVTHLYNVMPAMHHRDPGIIPAIFECRPFSSIVADGIHVSYPMIKLAHRLLQGNLFLITDAVTSTEEGTYPHRFNQDRFEMPDGTLSGSALTMLKAVKNCVLFCDIALPEAIQMASHTPAKMMGIEKRKGSIEVGFDADLIVFDDDFVLWKTILAGNLLYSK